MLYPDNPTERYTPTKDPPAYKACDEKDTDLAFEKVIQERLRNRFIVFVGALVIVFVFCVGVMQLASHYWFVDYFINYIFGIYFFCVGSFFYFGFRGTASDLKKLRSRRKTGGILPSNFKKMQDIDSWGKWD